MEEKKEEAVMSDMDKSINQLKAEIRAYQELPEEERQRIEDERHNAVNDALMARQSQSNRNRESYFRDELHGDERVGA